MMTEEAQEFNWKELDRRIQSSELSLVNQRVATIEAQVSTIQADLKHLDQRADKNEAHTARIEASVTNIEKFVKWGFGVLVGSGVLNAGNAFHLFGKAGPTLPEPIPNVREIPRSTEVNP